MIVHDFSCPDGHVFEAFTNWNDDTKPCPRCKKPGKMVFLPRGRDAQNFEPVVIFKGPNGKMRFPARSNVRTPKGYERVELRNSHEVHRFEREMNAKEIRRYQNKQEREERCVEPFRAALRSQLRGYAQNFSAYGKDFVETAIRENDYRQRGRFDPGFHIEAFHYDSSNRERWNDKDIGMRGKR